MNVTIELEGLDKTALLGLAKALEDFYYSEDFACPTTESCSRCPIGKTCGSILRAKRVCRKLGFGEEV